MVRGGHNETRHTKPSELYMWAYFQLRITKYGLAFLRITQGCGLNTRVSKLRGSKSDAHHEKTRRSNPEYESIANRFAEKAAYWRSHHEHCSVD